MLKQTNDHFYRDLKGFEEFQTLTDMAHYTDAPDDWYVVVSDVAGSTQAIADGKYKEVNLIGAAAIIAIINCAGDIALPYVFGGDGATILIPPSLLERALSTLSAVQKKVEGMHGIPLRVGCVPIRTLYDAGAWLKVAKLNLSPKTAQAMLQGTACSLAEQWLKQHDARVMRSETTSGDADLEGLQCRWQPITNRHGMILSLLVRVPPTHATQAWTIYQEIIASISAIYPDDASASPARTGGMSISLAPANLMKEARVHNGKNIVGQWLYFLRIFCISVLGRISFGYGLKLGSFDGKRYLQELVTNSDTRKFDEMLRMVLDSTPEQRSALETMLQARQQNGEIAYGIHASSHALMTCLVFNHEGNHIHFVDGADGGYALAAKQMKQQLTHA